jgi:thiol-disulfide isomerase/thioredoxin
VAKTKLQLGISAPMVIIMVLILSTGFFIGFLSYAPIQKARKKQLSAQRRRTEETRLSELVNKAAPEIVSETLEGERWHLSDQRGKIVLVFFWSVLCGSCIDEIPAMNGMYEKYGDRQDFVLVGVHRFPEKEIIACYCSAKDISWPQLYEMGDAAETGS